MALKPEQMIGNSQNVQFSKLTKEHKSGPSKEELETLVCSLVQVYLDTPETIQGKNLDSWSIEETVETIVSHSSSEIRNMSFKMLTENCKPNTVCETSLMPLNNKENCLAAVRSIGIKNINQVLQDLVDHVSLINHIEDISSEEYRQLLLINVEDTIKSASEIVGLVMGKVQPKKGNSYSEAKTFCWKEVEQKTAAFFFRRFAKESVLCLAAKLRKNLPPCSTTDEKRSVKAFLERVDWLMTTMISQAEGQQKKDTGVECPYKRIVMEISEDQIENSVKLLAHSLIHHLNPGPALGLAFKQEVETELDAVMDATLKWLFQQAEQHESKMDITSEALKKFERIVENLFALLEGLLVKESDTASEASVTDQPSLCDSSISQSCQYELQVCRRRTDTPVSEQSEDLPWQELVAPPLKHQTHACQFLATKMVKAFINPCAINIYWDDVNSVVMMLTEMLLEAIGDSEIKVKVTNRNTDKLLQAMKRDFLKNMDCPCWVQTNLLLKEPRLLQYTVDTFKKHLLTTPNNNVITFIKRMYRRRADTPVSGRREDLPWHELVTPPLKHQTQACQFQIYNSKEPKYSK